MIESINGHTSILYKTVQLHAVADYVPPIDYKAEIMMFIMRDITKAHRELDRKVGPGNLPYGQERTGIVYWLYVYSGNLFRESLSTQ